MHQLAREHGSTPHIRMCGASRAARRGATSRRARAQNRKTVNDTRDFFDGRRVTRENWEAPLRLGHEANERLLGAQLEACQCAPGVGEPRALEGAQDVPARGRAGAPLGEKPGELLVAEAPAQLGLDEAEGEQHEPDDRDERLDAVIILEEDRAHPSVC